MSVFRLFISFLQEILNLYIPQEEIPREDLIDLVDKSFAAKFDVPEASRKPESKNGKYWHHDV